MVVVESERRGALTADLADGLSRYLRVPVLGRYALVDPDVRPGQGAMNSAQRVAAVRRRYALEADLPPGARVLLVDDLVGSGWTLTMAAHDLRAGRRDRGAAARAREPVLTTPASRGCAARRRRPDLA